MRKNGKKGLLSVIGTIIASLTLVASIAYFSYPGKQINIQCNHVLYNDANQLTDYADLIILGQTEKDFSEFSPTFIYTPEGRYQDFYTVTDVKVVKTIKGDYNNNYIPIIQGAALVNSPFKKQNDLLINEGYSVLEKGKPYLLFLKKTDDGNYSIVSVNQGKFNMSHCSLGSGSKEVYRNYWLNDNYHTNKGKSYGQIFHPSRWSCLNTNEKDFPLIKRDNLQITGN